VELTHTRAVASWLGGMNASLPTDMLTADYS